MKSEKQILYSLADPEPEENEEAAEDRREMIRENGTVITRGKKHTIQCLTIIGQIEGHYVAPSQNKTTKYEHVIPQIVSIEEDPEIDGLLMILNTVGGDVEAGLAIAELVAGMKKPTVSLVLGGGHSIGVPLAVSAKRSFIAPSATMTIHPVRINGLVLGVPQAFLHFQRMQERIRRAELAVQSAGVDALRQLIRGKLTAFTGNSGVGKSSMLNALCPSLGLATGEVSEKLGRGRHTTRHVELFALSGGGYIADTPGFGSFDVEQMETIRPTELQHCFREFRPYLDQCRFTDCAHSREPGCAVLEALAEKKIHPSRHASYIRLLEQAKLVKDWETKK